MLGAKVTAKASTRRRPVRMRVIMPVIIDQAGRRFNADETDGVSRRHRD
jgi:hypothetical protein